jgi:hypothetical protein
VIELQDQIDSAKAKYDTLKKQQSTYESEGQIAKKEI